MDQPTVASLEAAAYTIPTDGPEADGTFAWDETTMVVVRARMGDVSGTGWTYAPAAAARVVTDLLAPVVVGGTALAPVTVYDAMQRAVRNAGRGGLVAMAVSAVDIALWDLAARLQGLPLARLWGCRPVPVPVYGSGGFTTYDEERLDKQLSGWLGLGLPRMKIKIGEDGGGRVDRDLARVRQVRDAVGDGVEVFVDANGGYAVGQARRVASALEDIGVTWYEEPVSSDDPLGLAKVRAATHIDVAAGEYGDTVDAFARLLEAGAVDCLQVDVTRCGGYTGWQKVLAVAGAAHLDVSGHCAPYLTVPVAALGGVRHLEWFHDHVRIEQSLVDGPADPVDGALTAVDGPGHGLTFRAGEAAHLRVA
jgi:L-alanine-DL-glutamate epimerase-like enolase superfamily enzyme